MDADRPHATPLALVPMEESNAEERAAAPPPTSEASGAPPATRASGAGSAEERELSIPAADEFLAAATQEYEEGRIDRALWARAFERAGNDNSLAVAAYLRARATALRVRKQDRETRNIEGKHGARERTAGQQAPAPTRRTGDLRARPWRIRLKARYAMAAAVAALASVVATVTLTSIPPETGSIELPVTAIAPAGTKPVLATPNGSAQPIAAKASGDKAEVDSGPPVETMVQQLKDAGNWNVLVLYASKWTRDQPNNAAAWNDLSIGYFKLHQFDDALAAATKAVELSPAQGSFWRHLGHVNLTLDRLPEAVDAFDRALAENSEDTDALCGAAQVARRSGRPKDADALASRIKSAGGTCQTGSDGESVAVAVRSTAANKPASPVRR